MNYLPNPLVGISPCWASFEFATPRRAQDDQGSSYGAWTHTMLPTVTALSLDSDTMRMAASREATIRLGLLVPAAEATIYHYLGSEFSALHPRAICTAYRKDGEQLSREEKKALGLRSNAALSRSSFEQLSEKGRGNPLRAHELTLLRSWFTLNRYQAVLRARSTDIEEFEDEFMYDSIGVGCAGCSHLDGLVRGDDVAIFPPEACVCETANYGIRMHIDWFKNVT